MKKSERRIRRVVLITGTVLCMGLSAFPAAAAGRIQKISLYLEGQQAKPGQFLDDTLPEITTSGEKYTIHKYDYVNDRVKWDRRDTPELMVELYYSSGYRLSKETVDKIRIRGLDCTYEKCEWIKKDELEEDDVRGVRIYLTFDSAHRARARRREWMPLRRKLWKRRRSRRKRRKKSAARRSLTAGIKMQTAGGIWRRTETGIPMSGRTQTGPGAI